MRFYRVVLAVAFLWAGAGGLYADTAKRRELFNGKDLSGWETWLSEPFAASQVPGVPRDEKGNDTKPLGLNNDPLGVFTVEEVDGRPAIHVSGEGFGTLTTVEDFSNYRLRLQFKWGERRFTLSNRPRNAGVLYHAYGKHGDVGGRWMNTHQFQVEEGGCGDYVGVGLVAADAHARTVDAKKRVYDPAGEALTFRGSVRDAAKCSRGGGEERPFGEWNTFEIYCVGDEVVQVLNGQVTARMTKSRKENGEALTGGRIAIQLEGAEMFFREMTIETLAAMPERF
jgi:hypothetical protein